MFSEVAKVHTFLTLEVHILERKKVKTGKSRNTDSTSLQK